MTTSFEEPSIVPFDCTICGESVPSVLYGGPPDECVAGEHMARDRICFDCHYWTCWLRSHVDTDPSREVVVNGTHYMVSPDTKSSFVGFGGQKFVIRFHDGREVVTHNLWHQGTIPERFRDGYPDNAEFVR